MDSSVDNLVEDEMSLGLEVFLGYMWYKAHGRLVAELGDKDFPQSYEEFAKTCVRVGLPRKDGQTQVQLVART